MRIYCDVKKKKEHRSGEWEVTEDHGWYKIAIRKCVYCNKILGDKVIK